MENEDLRETAEITSPMLAELLAASRSDENGDVTISFPSSNTVKISNETGEYI